MPTFKRYSGIKACEDYVQRTDTSGSGNNKATVRPFKNVNGDTRDGLNNYYASATGGKNKKYLSVNTIKASADDYNPDDYNGTSTGSCTFNLSAQTGGISYQVQFTANESATIKCLKFFKTLNVFTTSAADESVLMFAIYFDEPISVTAGQIKNISINFAYDEEQVTII